MTKIRIRRDFSVDSEWFWINNNDKTKNFSLNYYENALYLYHFKLRLNPAYFRHKLLPLAVLHVSSSRLQVSFYVGVERERFENPFPCHPLVWICYYPVHLQIMTSNSHFTKTDKMLYE